MEEWQKGLFLSLYIYFLIIVGVYIKLWLTDEIDNKAFIKAIGVMTLALVVLVILILPVMLLLEM